jgi:predicted RNase H-like HicB family nuclease
MRVTGVFEPASEGWYTCYVEEIPAAVSQGETLEEAKTNLLDALKLVLQCQRELAASGKTEANKRSRHREIKEGTVSGICKQLEIPRPRSSN